MKFTKFTEILGSTLAIIAAGIIFYIPYYRLTLYNKLPTGYLIHKKRRPPMFENYKVKY